MAAKEFIVAIELGSSYITGIAGKKTPDGNLQVLAVVREESTSCIRKGVVYNIDKTSACLTNIINKLEKILKSEISQVYVGVGGQSIRSIRNSSVKTFPEDTKISQDMINELMDNNRCTKYPDLEILDAVTQEYKVGTLYQIDPVGIQSDRIEGNYLNIVCRKAFYRNLNKCFDDAKISIAEMYLAPIALAHCVLSETEMRSGCLLVDLGAETTTVSVYHKNILRHLAVIPLGGNNITKDITTLQMEENEAEEMKIKYAKAFIEAAEINTEETLPIDAERSVSAKAFNELVEARVNEIIQNIWLGQVPQKYVDKLSGGIILTGGGAKMKEIKKAFTAITGIQRIRIAEKVNLKVYTTNKDININDIVLYTALGLLAKGDMNCAASTVTPGSDLFDTDLRTNSTSTDNQTTKNRRTDDFGKVESLADKKRREEALHPENKPVQEKPDNTPKANWLSRGVNFFQKLGTTIFSEENEDDYNH